MTRADWRTELMQVSNPHRRRRETWDAPGKVHALTFSCHGRQPLLTDEQRCQWLVDAVDRCRSVHDVGVVAYVVMPEHVHLMLQPRNESAKMSAILTSIKQPVARCVANRWRQDADGGQHLAIRTDRTVFRFWQQGGGFDHVLRNKPAVMTMLNYIHQNPVRRGLVDDPVSWKWSSAGWYEGRQDAPLEIDAFPW